MSTLEPPDDFDWSSLDDVAVDESEVIDYSSLSDAELIARLVEVEDKLKKIKQLHVGTTETEAGRELHSQRTAIALLLKQKGLMG